MLLKILCHAVNQWPVATLDTTKENHYRVKCLLFQSPLREFSWGLTFPLLQFLAKFFLLLSLWASSYKLCPAFFYFPELPAFPWEFLNSILHNFSIAILVILAAAFLATHSLVKKHSSRSIALHHAGTLCSSEFGFSACFFSFIWFTMSAN